jgi:hypothetical protein
MRKPIDALIVATVLVASMVAPLAAAEPPVGAPPIYLPFVAGTDAPVNPPDDEVLVIDGSIVLGEEPNFGPVAPKPAGAADPAPLAVPDDPKPAPMGPVTGSDGVEGATVDGWATFLNDGMETDPWPLAPAWRILDADGSVNGTYFWNDENDMPFRGGWSAWPAGNALDGSGPHAPNMRSWMIYGPISLADAARATLTFQYWAQNEFNYDWFGWFASPNGSNFYGQWMTGSSGTWRPGVIDFANVPGYGSMLGDGSVWIGFYFHSDATTQLRGTFVDDIFIQKFNCPSQFTTFWYNSLSQSTFSQRAVTCESYPFSRTWSTAGPVPLFGQADNWSLYMTATPFFSTSKTWTFETRSDDGVTVWVDGVKVIDAMFDQDGSVTRRGTRYLSAGVHTVWVQYYERTGSATLNVRWY